MGNAQGTKASTRPRSSKAAWTPETGARWGLADGLGLTLLVTLTLAWPGAADPSAVTALFVTVGALACLPFAVARLSHQEGGWRRAPLPVFVALGLLVWGVISAFGSDAPMQVSLYGWLGRSDGLLTLVGVTALLIAASSLTRDEVDRVVTWLLVAGTVLVVEAFAQLAGLDYPPRSAYEGLSAALGNPNFFAAGTAVLAILALGRALGAQRPAWKRWASLALFLGLAVCSGLSLSVQGPVALAIGLVAAAIAWSLQHRGRGRVVALSLSGIALLGGLVGLVLVAFQAGPFAAVRQAQTIGYREAYWEAAWRMMSGLPVFGSGPDGFARYVAEFRTERYLAGPGSQIRVSAAHDVPLQYGATFGVLGLVLWVALMVATGIFILRALLRGVDHVWLVISVTGAWVAYVAQAMISIDAPGLKALGWLLTGLVVALASDRAAPPSAKGPSWRPWLAGGLGVIALAVWWPTIAASATASNQTTFEGASSDMRNALVQCPVRQQILLSMTQGVPLATLAPLALDALELDPRCPNMAIPVSEIAFQSGDLEGATRAAEIAVETDPLAPGSWLVLSRALAASGDQAAADAALEEARRLAAIDPTDDLDEALAEPSAPEPPSP